MAWKALCRDILEDPETQKAIRLAAKVPSGSGYAALIKLLAEHGEGVPEHTLTVKHATPREQIAGELTRLAARQEQTKASQQVH